MSYHDSTPDQASSDESERGALRLAMVDLAGTMPDDPRRAGNVHTRARRLRRRRQVARATVIAAAVAGTVGAAAFAAVRPGSAQVSIIPSASEPSSGSASSPLPACSAVLASLPPGSVTPPAATTGSAASRTKQDATNAAAKPAASGGSEPPSERKQSDGPVDPAAKAAAAPDASRYVKSMARIVSARPGSLSLNTLDGPVAGQSVVALTGPKTAYAVGAQSCVDPDLVPGMTVAVVLVRADDGSYSAQQISLFQS